MANINPHNFGIIEGRLVNDIAVFDNRDGSKTILLNVAVKDNLPDRNGERHTQFVTLKAYYRSEKDDSRLGPYDYMKKGDRMSFSYTVKTSRYDKDGQIMYSQDLVVTAVNLDCA